MRAEHWHQVTEIFHAARERDPVQRVTFLAEACRGDPTLRQEVEAMLAAHDDAGRFGKTPLVTSLSGLAQRSSVGGTHLAPGSRLGPYQIVSLLGAGGMGQVYRAFDPRLHREIAIKVASERFSERFHREVRAVATLNHPNICTLHDVGPNYLVTELVEGETLRECLRRALSIERSFVIARQVLEALRAAHHAGIVHRDLKPENIMVRFDGYVKVLDFGLAKRVQASHVVQTESAVTTETRVRQNTDDVETQRISAPNQILGTVAYMSPEQILGHEIDQRSDLFAFGIICYEMLTGQHPWLLRSPEDTMHAILHDDPPPIQTTSPMHTELATILQRLLRKNPAERYSSAEAVLEALGSGATLQASSPPTWASPTPLRSIAVLPFVFFSEVEERKAFSLGFADALITVLGRLEDITVLPTSAILNYAAGTDPGLICRDLGVRYVLQANIQKLGTHWRVSVQLFDSAAQRVVFSEKYDFTREDVFEVQDEIGLRVVESLQNQFPVAIRKSRDRYSSDPQAYSEFMSGLQESYSDRPEALHSAIQHLASAVERDPKFALAHATLSYVCMNMHFTLDTDRTWLQKAEHHCRRALTLDPALPEGHFAQAYILWSPAKNFQHADAIAALEEVLALQPNFEHAHNRLGSICLHIGRLHEAQAAFEQGQRSNPKNFLSHNVNWVHLFRGDFARAQEGVEVWLRESPGHKYALWFRPLPTLLTGDMDLADQQLTEALRQLPDEPLILSLQGLLHARRGKSDPALQCVRRALDFARSFGHTHHTYYQIASVYAVLGERDKAMVWLERSADTGFACWPFFQLDPHLESLRNEPEFNRLVDNLQREFGVLKIERL
jgi:serine/threonine protein kinase/tetratricopeptide (TPR) repeat protein